MVPAPSRALQLRLLLVFFSLSSNALQKVLLPHILGKNKSDITCFVISLACGNILCICRVSFL